MKSKLSNYSYETHGGTPMTKAQIRAKMIQYNRDRSNFPIVFPLDWHDKAFAFVAHYREFMIRHY